METDYEISNPPMDTHVLSRLSKPEISSTCGSDEAIGEYIAKCSCPNVVTSLYHHFMSIWVSTFLKQKNDVLLKGFEYQ